MWENRTGDGFASMGISNPPSWTVPLSSDPSQSLQLREPSHVFEGLPLPNTIEVMTVSHIINGLFGGSIDGL